ncbi:MAG: prepilin-type N-terminal cleavage/methylation domain-containing protein [Verrucomicrobiota bacterium]|jgi:type II secretion system protein H
MKTADARTTNPRCAFTLIEIMVVVAIIGLIAAMSVPSILQTFRKEGMRKAVSDIMDLCSDARTQAIYSGQPAQIVFYPAEKRMELAGASAGSSPAPPTKGARSVTLPADVDIAMLDIEMIDRGGQEKTWVNFNPNGTCEELTLVLHCGDEWQKITLEYSTALASVGPVTR